MSICPNLHHNGPMRYIYSTLNQMCVISKKFQSPDEYTVSFLIKDKNSMELAKWIDTNRRLWNDVNHFIKVGKVIKYQVITSYWNGQKNKKKPKLCLSAHCYLCALVSNIYLCYFLQITSQTPVKLFSSGHQLLLIPALGHPQITAASRDSNLISAITFSVLTQLLNIISWNFSLFWHNKSPDKNDKKKTNQVNKLTFISLWQKWHEWPHGG